MASDKASGRPLSPHLQIWRWTPPMVASVLHRATGIALYTGTILLVFWAFAAAQGPEFFAPVGKLLASPFGVFVLFGYAWSLLFHTFNGLRHLYWDMGRGLTTRYATQTAWFALAASLILAIVIVAVGLSARGN